MAQKTTVEIDLDEAFDARDREDVVVDEDAAAGAAAVDDDVVDEDIDPAEKLPRNARKNADGSVTVTLRFPQTVTSRKDGRIRERRFSDIVMHRLNGADQRAIAGVAEDMSPVVAFARSARLPQAVMNVLFDKLDAADINAMGEVLSHFFGSGRKTGR